MTLCLTNIILFFRIKSPPLKLSKTSICISFDFHMYGHHTGKLEIFLQHGDNRKSKKTWQGLNENRWVKVKTSFTAANADQVCRYEICIYGIFPFVVNVEV